MNPESKILRQKGNDILLSIQDHTPNCIKESRLKEANNLYLDAYKKSVNEVEKSSAAKNISTACFKLLKFYVKNESNNRLCHYYMQQFIEYINEAVEIGREIQGIKWYQNLCTTTSSAIQCYLNFLMDIDSKKRVEYLYKLLEKSCNHAKCIINFYISKYIFNQSIELAESKKIKEASTCLNDFNYHYEECLRTFKYFEVEDTYPFIFDIDEYEIESLNDDYLTQKCVIEGKVSKLLAQNLLKTCIEEIEDLNFDLLYDIIDLYHDSLIKTRDNDIECEAEVSSDLGFIYDEVMKLKDRAKEYFQDSFHLAESLRPKIFTQQKWYIRCSSAIRRYQQEVIDEETKQLDSEREAVMNDIKDDIDKVQSEAEKGSFSFLEYIYKGYPPKNPKHVLPKKLESGNIKKSVREAIIHYHPDKNSKQEFGSKWYFISEEITKNLNTFYNTLKGAD